MSSQRVRLGTCPGSLWFVRFQYMITVSIACHVARHYCAVSSQVCRNLDRVTDSRQLVMSFIRWKCPRVRKFEPRKLFVELRCPLTFTALTQIPLSSYSSLRSIGDSQQRRSADTVGLTGTCQKRTSNEEFAPSFGTKELWQSKMKQKVVST